MKKKIRFFIWRLLGLDKELKSLQLQNETLSKTTWEAVEVLHKALINYKDLLDETRRTLYDTRRLINIGVDVSRNEYDHSFAIVCIKGKTDIIRLLDLSHANSKHLVEILKQFEGTNRVMDLPYGMKQYFNLK